MGCTKCGSDTQLIQLLLDKYIRDAIEDGRIQEGLRDCNADPLRRDTNVLTCDLLEDAICQLISEGHVCFEKPIALDYDKSTGVLKIIMSDGSTMDTKVDANDVHISNMTLLNDTLTLSYNNGNVPLSVDLSGFKSKVQVVEDSDGNITITDDAGTTKTIPAPIKFNETITKQGDKYGVNPEFHKDKVSATLNADGSVTLTDGTGTTTEIASPNRTVVLKNSSGKTVVAYAHKTEN